MLFSPIFGFLGDRFNRKWIMATGIFFWSGITLASSFIPSDVSTDTQLAELHNARKRLWRVMCELNVIMCMRKTLRKVHWLGLVTVWWVKVGYSDLGLSVWWLYQNKLQVPNCVIHGASFVLQWSWNLKHYWLNTGFMQSHDRPGVMSGWTNYFKVNAGSVKCFK